MTAIPRVVRLTPWAEHGPLGLTGLGSNVAFTSLLLGDSGQVTEAPWASDGVVLRT